MPHKFAYIAEGSPADANRIQTGWNLGHFVSGHQAQCPLPQSQPVWPPRRRIGANSASAAVRWLSGVPNRRGVPLDPARASP
jgi:hypothetical protein